MCIIKNDDTKTIFSTYIILYGFTLLYDILLHMIQKCDDGLIYNFHGYTYEFATKNTKDYLKIYMIL